MLDLLIRNATLQDGRKSVDIACRDGLIVDIGPGLVGESNQILDAGGYLVAPPFVEGYLHVDAAVLHGNPYINESGQLYEASTI